ncbi:MAG TPA: hypothetical protein VNN08_09600, partial [Thermoanaerobaculia bacterium]|nr:hypothetical protein [Thermoanaerobaculia bacterium]
FTTFLTTFQNVVSQLYATDAWESFWQAVSVEGGWTEPALRGGLDAAIHLIQNTGGQFVPGFNFGDYPRYSAWSPAVGSSDATRALGRTIGDDPDRREDRQRAAGGPIRRAGGFIS